MKKSYTNVFISALALLILISLFGCTKREPQGSTYNIDQFCSDLKSKNYEFKISDAEEDFLPTTRKRLEFENGVLEVYLYEKAEDMEIDAQRIDIGGCSYKTENKGVFVSWVSHPHFFKMGNIIVQYIGENEIIISDLTDILGEEFAGYSKVNNPV